MVKLLKHLFPIDPPSLCVTLFICLSRKRLANKVKANKGEG